MESDPEYEVPSILIKYLDDLKNSGGYFTLVFSGQPKDPTLEIYVVPFGFGYGISGIADRRELFLSEVITIENKREVIRKSNRTEVEVDEPILVHLPPPDISILEKNYLHK